MRFLADALFFKTSLESWRQYVPCLRVSLKKFASIIFVRASANWAPEWTQCNFMPSERMSLIERAKSWVLNSEQFGMAVRVVKSYRLLQSVMAKSSLVTL